MMTSKEALNKIQHHINGTELSGKELLECYKTIDKALERLEELENDKLLDQAEIEELERKNAVLNHNLEEKVEIIFELEEKYKNLKVEYEELSKDELCFEKRCDKLEKAIEILKSICEFEIYKGWGAWFIKCKGSFLELEEEEAKQYYDLLKEVFGE